MDEKKNRDQQEAPAKEEAVKKEGGNNKFLFIAIVAGVVVVNAIIAFVLVQVTRPQRQDEIDSKLRADSLKLATEMATSMGATTEAPIAAVVNIAGTEGQRFLKASVIFEYDEQKYPNLNSELEKRAPKFKDILLAHLSKLTLIEVTEPEAKDKIRKDLLRILNNSLPPKTGEIREVLFTEYIIQ